MPENSPKFPLVRCPKCGRLLPELPPYSVYRCGGCDGFLRAQKKSPLSSDLSENSSEARPSEGNHSGIVGVSHGSERSTPTRVSKSPAREKNSDGLDGHRNSPIRENVLGEFDVQSKSSGGSAIGDDRKTQLREKGCGHGKSPAFSVRGGIGKATVIGTDDIRSAKRENFVADPEEIESRDRVDSPRRRRTWHNEDQSGEEYGKLYGRRRVELPCDDSADEGDHGVARRNIDLRGEDGYVGVFGKPRKNIGFDGLHGGDNLVGSSNYRTELLREYNELHEKLIRIGDLISHSQNGQGDQGFASKYFYGGPDDYGYDNPSLPQFPRRTIHRRPPYYHQKSMDSIYDPRRKNIHHPACSCSDCHTSNLQAHMYRKCSLDPTHKQSSQPRSSVDSKSNKGSSAHDHRKKVLVVNQNDVCHPIAGGAPFVICYNCFQLLRIPGKLVSAKKNKFRLQCGSCLTILSHEFNANGSTFPCTDSEPS